MIITSAAQDEKTAATIKEATLIIKVFIISFPVDSNCFALISLIGYPSA